MTAPPGYILIRPETLVGVQKAMEAALGARAGECLAAGGRVGGAAATAALEGDATMRARRLLSAGREIGWGEFALERLTADTLVVTVAGSPFARAYGAAAAPVSSHPRRARGARLRHPRASGADHRDRVRRDGR
jgi:hypothetical protein